MGAFYQLFIPKQAVGLSLVYFDLFVATGTGSYLKIHEVNPIVSGAVAVTGVVGLDLHLTRTTAIGTTGTAATAEGTDTTAATICALDSTQPLVKGITARLTPGGGATGGALLNWTSMFTEETAAATYNSWINMARLPGVAEIPAITVRENTGIRVVQGAVASVGNIGFNVTFEVLPNS